MRQPPFHPSSSVGIAATATRDGGGGSSGGDRSQRK